MLTEIASAVLAIAAAFDGYTTVRFLKKGDGVEGDPIMVWLYGGNAPSTEDVVLTGTIAIFLEIVWLFAMHRFVAPWFSQTCNVLVLGQAAIHVVAGIRNLKVT